MVLILTIGSKMPILQKKQPMKYIAYLLSVTLLFASCAGEGGDGGEKTDVSQLIPEHRYALEICECMGTDNKNQLVELNKIIKEKGRDIMSQDTTLRERFAPVGEAMTACMNKIETQFEADGIDPMSDTFEENFYTGLKEQCPEMYEFMISIDPDGVK